MDWFERGIPKRLEPGLVVPGSLAVLCVALHYSSTELPPETGGEEGEADPPAELWSRVARYARGEDYHRVFERRLKLLEQRLQAALPGLQTRRYVDTGPILERELSQRAGLGRIGKNTNLLHRAGSWFLLGELFLNVEAENPRVQDSDGVFSYEAASAWGSAGAEGAAALIPNALEDVCGQCTKCLEACPTGALPEPFRLDARRCISFWTIEHRGPFTDEVADLVGDWVFGCDICQEVCPWNQTNYSTGDPEGVFAIPERRRSLDLVGLLKLQREEYVELFRHSPMKRAKLGGLKRNVATVMGNSTDDKEALRFLQPLLDEVVGAGELQVRHAALRGVLKLVRRHKCRDVMVEDQSSRIDRLLSPSQFALVQKVFTSALQKECDPAFEDRLRKGLLEVEDLLNPGHSEPS